MELKVTVLDTVSGHLLVFMWVLNSLYDCLIWNWDHTSVFHFVDGVSTNLRLSERTRFITQVIILLPVGCELVIYKYKWMLANQIMS